MKVVYPDQIKEIDRICHEEYGIPTIRLMEQAGRNVYIQTINHLKSIDKSKKQQKVSCVCGKGNNGGDGFVAARYFSNNGNEVSVFIFEDHESVGSGDSYTNYVMLKNMGIEIIRISSDNMKYVKDEIEDSDVVIDAMLGTGINSDVKDKYSYIIDVINDAKKPLVVSVDIPSGIDGRTGKVMRNAVKADLTVVLALLKAGNLQYPGRDHCGNIVVCDIGVPKELTEAMKIKLYRTEPELVRSYFSKRNSDTNKRTYGKIGVITGSKGMTGAGIMASQAAMKTGAGLVYTIVPDGLSDIYEINSLETVTVSCGVGDAFFNPSHTDNILKLCEELDVIILGPGIGTNEETENFVYEFLQRINNIKNAYSKFLILDADALNIISKDINILREVNIPAILTPHPKEMARLCNVDVRDVQTDRINSARFLADEYDKIVVLKGAATITAYADGVVYINTTGNPGMATAGTGDVLCGIIAGICSLSRSELSAPAGVYLHGLAGDIASYEYGEYSMTARDVLNSIYKGIMKIQNTGENGYE